jgi:hypothetical protein
MVNRSGVRFSLGLVLLPILGSCGLMVPMRESALAGGWEYFRLDGTQVLLTFDQGGVPIDLRVNRPDGASVNLGLRAASSTIDDAGNVRVSLTLDDGEHVFTGVLVAEGNLLDGSLSREIRLPGDTIAVFAGAVSFQRLDQ